MKRLLDIAGALVGLVALSPLLGLLWLAVVVESGLPGLFRQRRVGRDGREFVLLKFRTMTVNREAEKGAFEAGSSARVTGIGRFLRKTKLDELPQLWNVLVGDMSLVGPRPEVRKWVDAYPERWAKVLTVRPGITNRHRPDEMGRRGRAYAREHFSRARALELLSGVIKCCLKPEVASVAVAP